jgi:hypothetical protein
MGLDWSKIDFTFVDPNPEKTATLLRKTVASTAKHTRP